jgi:hypothetical protein
MLYLTNNEPPETASKHKPAVRSRNVRTDTKPNLIQLHNLGVLTLKKTDYIQCPVKFRICHDECDVPRTRV